MPSNKIRFEVFKRDNFRCQYCGRTPPAIVLELDHIIPKSQGGPDNIDNYITSCSECNRGKGKRSLSVIPDTAVKRLEILKEKRLQLRAFNRFIEKQEEELASYIAGVIHVFHENFPDLLPSSRFIDVTIKRFVSLLPAVKVEEAMALACSTKSNDGDAALRYFCGICWNWIKKPETRNW